MNLQQLEYFKRIAETENFTTAATQASVTQPAISKAISKLEEELNVPLFERNGRNVTLTAFGKSFLKHADIALMEIEKGINELKNMQQHGKSIISIASTYCISTYLIPFIISDYLSCCPDTKFQFNQETTPEIIRDLKSGRIDLGFYDEADLNSDAAIESIPVNKQEYVLIVSKNHPLASKTIISLKELKNESFIVFSEESKNKLVSYSEFLDYTPKISLHSNEISMLGGLVAAGAGITIVANTPLINTNTISVIKIKEDLGYKITYMGWLRDSHTSQVIKEFRNYVISRTAL